MGVQWKSHGWTLNHITCQIRAVTLLDRSESRTLDCVHHFTRTGLTTQKMLLKDEPTAIVNGNEADVHHELPLDFDMSRPPHVRVDIAHPEKSQLPSSLAWGDDLLSQLQILKLVGVDFEVEPSKDLSFETRLHPDAPEAAKTAVATTAKPLPQRETHTIPVGRGHMKIRFDNLFIFKDLATELSLRGISFESVRFDIRSLQDMGVEVALSYYVDSSAHAVKASTSLPLISDSSAADPLGQAKQARPGPISIPRP